MTVYPFMCKADRLNVKVFETRKEMGQQAAGDVSSKIKELLSVQEDLRMVFASAPSQNELLEGLAADNRIDWSRITVFHMDEYMNLPPGNSKSFASFLKNKLFDRVHPKEVHLIQTANGAEKECARYTKLIKEKQVDIVCLGIGENGHIAFNDPPVADFDDQKTMKAVKLDGASRRQQVNDGCFASLDEVPKEALTLTIPALVSAKFLYCVAPGKTKAKAVQSVLHGKITVDCPASVLRKHENCTLYLDQDSFGGGC
ncbi:glucosamine-6-phosphate deaminase [Fictibacillus sp. NRS-1165]|uniref:glucosamine-6-phosphate deaminase n=1 Tax=Fictibacillus sp. NRS-1165 TaxID=3144463 RepID=UPI003D2136E0